MGGKRARNDNTFLPNLIKGEKGQLFVQDYFRKSHPLCKIVVVFGFLFKKTTKSLLEIFLSIAKIFFFTELCLINSSKQALFSKTKAIYLSFKKTNKGIVSRENCSAEALG